MIHIKIDLAKFSLLGMKYDYNHTTCLRKRRCSKPNLDQNTNFSCLFFSFRMDFFPHLDLNRGEACHLISIYRKISIASNITEKILAFLRLTDMKNGVCCCICVYFISKLFLYTNLSFQVIGSSSYSLDSFLLE